MIEISEFMPLGHGGRARGFGVGGCRVLVTPDGGESDAYAKELTAILAARADSAHATWDKAHRVAEEATRQLAAAERTIEELRSKVPPPTPARLLGTGTVRFDDRGVLWLLNRREDGWSSFGVRLDGWDDLFRRFAVRITGHGVDSHGPWWEAKS